MLTPEQAEQENDLLHPDESSETIWFPCTRIPVATVSSQMKPDALPPTKPIDADESRFALEQFGPDLTLRTATLHIDAIPTAGTPNGREDVLHDSEGGERVIEIDDARIQLSEIWSQIEEKSTVFIVQTEFHTFSGENSFVVGPVSICGRVLGLYDEEYGWPVNVRLDAIDSLRDLVPGWRRHPFILRGEQRFAACIQFSEYQEIRSRMNANRAAMALEALGFGEQQHRLLKIASVFNRRELNMFTFCTRCGCPVLPYMCNANLGEDFYDLRLATDAAPEVGLSCYFCRSCDSGWYAFGMGDTGNALHCGHFNSMYVQWCATCGVHRSAFSNGS